MSDLSEGSELIMLVDTVENLTREMYIHDYKSLFCMNLFALIRLLLLTLLVLELTNT